MKKKEIFLNKKFVLYVRYSKQALNHGLKLEKVHRVIKFSYEQWLKTYIVLNSKKKHFTS